MSKFQVFGNKSPEISDREIRHQALARRVLGEGIVLLKNDDVLPLSPQHIALFGPGSRLTVKGGSGSGEVNDRHSVSVEEGLKNAGFTFSTLYMDKADEAFRKKRQEWKDSVDKAIEKYNVFTTMKMFDEIHTHPEPTPSCTPVLEDEIDNTTDVAIYVLSRQAGEGNDRDNVKGDYLLSDMEKESLELLSKHYGKLILVINCGSSVDLSVLDEVRIDAVLFLGQGGMEGGNALADVLTGKVTPSGKLTDTWARCYEDFPSSDTYSHLSGNVEQEDYREGIYVGYRYFTTFHVRPRFPFGFGLSYTRFGYRMLSLEWKKSIVSLKVNVRNNGDRYSGKEVLQVYVRKPDGRLETESLSLVAFRKSKELSPSMEETLILDFDFRDLAVYDEQSASFVLLKGEYGVYLGTSSEENYLVAVLELDEETMVEKVSNIHKVPLLFDVLKREQEERSYDSSITRYHISKDEIAVISHPKYQPSFDAKISSVLKRLSTKDKVRLVVGGGYGLKGYNSVMGACGRTYTGLLKKGIPNIVLSDGPAGLNVTPKTVTLKSGNVRFIDEVPEVWQWGWIRKFGFLARANPKKGTPAYRYMTCWPSETVQAQTWNTELLEEVGKAVGEEMLEIGVSVWLAPGMNLHRNPLCGRNFEYYSEDPLVSGRMAASITRGVQSCKGVGVSVKHFCLNNQEDNRYHNSSNVSQRALREIYLRNFRIAIQEGKPWTIMSSYNLVNHVYVNNSPELLDGVLRNEWGFEGLVMSDWSACDNSSYFGAINTGNDLIMPGNKAIQKQLLKEVRQGKVRMESLDVSCMRVLKMIFASSVNKDFKE